MTRCCPKPASARSATPSCADWLDSKTATGVARPSQSIYSTGVKLPSALIVCRVEVRFTAVFGLTLHCPLPPQNDCLSEAPPWLIRSFRAHSPPTFITGVSLPEPSLPGPSLPGPSLPGPSLPGPSLRPLVSAQPSSPLPSAELISLQRFFPARPSS